MTDERTIKHRRVADYLESHDLEAVLLARRCNFSWYTCGAHNYVANTCDAGNSWLLVSRERACVLTDNVEAPRLLEEELADSGIEVVEFPYFDPAERERAFARAIGSMRTASDAPAPVTLPVLGRDFDELRWTLTPQEIDRYRAVCGDTVAAIESVARAARPGLTENELAGMLADALRGRDLLPWLILVGADERVERFRHPLPTGKTVESYFMLVTCCERGGLISACTRLASFGPISAELADKHRAVATVDAALISATQPGATLGEILAIGQDAYAAGGFGNEWRLHHQGGSCGYLPREVKATPGEPTVVRAEQAFAWNPSITGTKSEDTILARRSGPEPLAAPTDWPTIRGEWKGFTLDRPAILVR